MPDFIVPVLEKIVATGVRGAVTGMLSSAGVITNAATGVAGTINATATALNSISAFATSTGTQALSAGARVAAMSGAAGGGNFAGVLGTATNNAAGTISRQTLNELIAKGYKITEFQICICPNCVGAAKDAAAHIRVTGFNIEAPPNAAEITRVDPLTKSFEKTAGQFKGVNVKVDGSPEPPSSAVNIGLIIAIALALKNQIEAGLRTFSDVVITGLYRGNAGGKSPFHNVFRNLIGGYPNTRTVYPLIDEAGNAAPQMSGVDNQTPYENLPQIANRPAFPNGEQLVVQERIRNEEQAIQGYFECVQYYHFCFARNIFSNQEAPTPSEHQVTLDTMLGKNNNILFIHPMYLTFRNQWIHGRDPSLTVLAEEVFPVGNPSGRWETNGGLYRLSDFNNYPDLSLEIDNSAPQVGNRTVVERIYKTGHYYDGKPAAPSFISADSWLFIPDAPMVFDHIVVFSNGYRLRMRPQLCIETATKYLGRVNRLRWWTKETTALKDALSIIAAAIAPLTAGWSSIIIGIANMFIPNIEYDEESDTTIDVFAARWYVPYALHYGVWTKPGEFVLAPAVDAPSCSFVQKQSLDISPLPRNTNQPPYAYFGGTKSGVAKENNFAPQLYNERADAYPSIYNLSITPLTLATLTRGTITPFAATLNWTSIFSADSYAIDVSLHNDFRDYVVENRIVNGLTTAITGLTPNTTYYARVRGREQGFESDNSNVLPFTTSPFAPPVALAATNIDFTQFTAQWTEVPYSTDYVLTIARDAAMMDVLTEVQTTALSFTALNLTPNTNYWYRVRARAGQSVSGFSNVVQATTLNLTLDPPVATSPTNVATTSFRANWTSVVNAVDYLLDVSLQADFSTTILNGQVVAGTSFLVPNLTANTTYYYRVRARNGAVVSVFSNVQSVQTPSDAVVVPPPPFGTPSAFASNITHNSFAANWTAVQDATSYELDVSLNSDMTNPFIAGEILTTTSRTVTGLNPQTPYYFRVRAKNAQETSPFSATVQAITLQIPVNAPTATAATGIGLQGYTANWLPVTNATLYRIYAGTNPQFLSQIGTSSGTSLPVVGLQPNTTYYYRIDVQLPSASVQSNIISVTTLTPPPPPGLDAPVATDGTDQTSSSFRANWLPVPNADEYLTDVSTSPTFSSFVVQNLVRQAFNGTLEGISGLSPSTTYYYRIRARNAQATSGYSNVISVSTRPAAIIPTTPVMTHFTEVTFNSFRFHWNAVAGATSYRVEISVDDPTFASPAFTNFAGFATSGHSSSMFFAPLQSNRRYYVRMTASGGSGTSPYSNVISVYLDIATGGSVPRAPISNTNGGTYFLNAPTLSPPNALATPNTQVRDVTSTSAKLSWYPMPNQYQDGSHVGALPPAGAFLVSVGKDTNGGTAFIPAIGQIVVDKQSVNGTSVVITGLQPDTEYFYSIISAGMNTSGLAPYAAFRSGNEGFGYFNTQVVHTFRTLPQGVVAAPSNIGQVRFQANWDAIPNVSYTQFELTTQAGQLLSVQNFFSTTNSVIIQPQLTQTNFRYRVRGVDAQGNFGAWSAYADVNVQNWFNPVPMTFDQITENSFRVTWSNPANAVNMRVIIKQGTTTIVDTFVTGTTYTATGLTAGTTYNVQLLPRNQYAESYMNPALLPIVSPVTTLSSGAPPPIAPTLAFTSATTNSAVVTLSNTQADVSYSMDVALDAGFTQLVASGVYAVAGANTLLGLLPDTLYYVRARGNNGTNGAWSAAVNGRTLLAAPNLLVGEEITENSFRARWTSPQSVVQSRIDVARDAGFTDMVLSDTIVTGGLTEVVTGLQMQTDYWVRVRTENPRGTSPNSNVRKITTDEEWTGSVSVAMI